MISIKKVALKDLKDFINSAEYKNLKNKPISKGRAHSYVNNPRATKDDIVLYMAFISNELVGYRTILSDFFIIKNKKEFFGWLSGSWVHLNYRRKGISTLIFNEVLKDWKSKLMYTNYADISKLLYDKTAQFNLIKQLHGTKYYTRFCLADILPRKKKIFKSTIFLWKTVDAVANSVLDIRNIFNKPFKKTNNIIKENELLNTEIKSFIDNFTINTLFQRNQEEFHWIKNYPWISTDVESKLASNFYFFSSYSKQFESNRYTIYTAENKLIGFLIITVRDGHLKIPFANFYEKYSKEVVQFIVNKSVELKIKTILVYNKNLESELNNKLPFVNKKAFNQKYFASKTFKNLSGEIKELTIQAGDGDVVFT